MSETVAVPEIDKSSWPPGPWKDEPDRVDFVHAGYACLIARHPLNGHLCGYVGVDEPHPYFGKGYDDCDVEAAHRSLTYSDLCDGLICHVPQPGMPKRVWWLGFDCAHAGDLSPGIRAIEQEAARSSPQLAKLEEKAAELNRRFPELREVYRELAYVRRVTEKLAEELRAKTLADA